MIQWDAAFVDESNLVYSFSATDGGSGLYGERGKPGTATLQLLNSDGRFTALNASSPLFGQLAPGAAVWVAATYSATTYPLWAGWVRRIVPRTMSGKQPAVVDVICEDALGLWSDRSPNLTAQDQRTYGDFRLAALTAIGNTSAQRTLALEPDMMAATGEYRDGLSALLEKLNQATGTRHYTTAAATTGDLYRYVTVNRAHKLEAAVDETIDYASQMTGYDVDTDGLIEEARVGVFPREFTDYGPIWTMSSVPMGIAATKTQTIWANFGAPVREATVVVNNTGTLVVTPTAFGDAMKIVLTATTAVHIDKLQVWGRRMVEPQDRPAFATDPLAPRLAQRRANEYALAGGGPETGEEVNNDYIGSLAMASGVGDHLVWRRGVMRPEPSITIVDTFPAMLQRKLFDHVAVTYPSLSVSNLRMEIVGSKWKVVDKLWIREYDLHETPIQSAMTLFNVGGSAAQGVGGAGVLLR
jgi:hypothetical protein